MKYTTNILKGKDFNQAIRGQVLENGIIIATFKRRVHDHGQFIEPLEVKFLSSQSEARFSSFADSLSIEETIEAITRSRQYGTPEYIAEQRRLNGHCF